jgi:hypothetical protein
VAKFTETVTSVTGGGSSADFRANATPLDFNMFYDDFDDTSTEAIGNLTGSGFNDGRLILTAESLANPLSSGPFSVTSFEAGTPLDGFNDNDYPTIESVSGAGSNTQIVLDGFTPDGDFFLTEIGDFSLQISNVSLGLPFLSVDPSSCFTVDFLGSGAVGNTQSFASANCDLTEDPTMTGTDGKGGLTPDVGTFNGLGVDTLGGPDFLAQTDFNSTVTGTVPSPAPLALIGLGLLGLRLNRNRGLK